jgi:hypothetical protein
MVPPAVTNEPVHVPRIRHGFDALDDRNPFYLAEKTRIVRYSRLQ